MMADRVKLLGELAQPHRIPCRFDRGHDPTRCSLKDMRPGAALQPAAEKPVEFA
jgi:hypothetical protein